LTNRPACQPAVTKAGKSVFSEEKQRQGTGTDTCQRTGTNGTQKAGRKHCDLNHCPHSLRDTQTDYPQNSIMLPVTHDAIVSLVQ
jgi:hypothetical protein